jgi:hypothetical protein
LSCKKGIEVSALSIGSRNRISKTGPETQSHPIATKLGFSSHRPADNYY